MKNISFQQFPKKVIEDFADVIGGSEGIYIYIFNIYVSKKHIQNKPRQWFEKQT